MRCSFPPDLRPSCPAAAQFHKDIEPILTEYCYDCHGDGAKKGGVAFDELKSDEEFWPTMTFGGMR